MGFCKSTGNQICQVVKTAIIILILTFINLPDSPGGVWIYKEDFSRIEIIENKGKLTGRLISTRNPYCEPGTEILKDFIYLDGKWQGKLYVASKKRWVDAYLIQKEGLLFIELDLGYDTKKFHWYKEKR